MWLRRYFEQTNIRLATTPREDLLRMETLGHRHNDETIVRTDQRHQGASTRQQGPNHDSLKILSSLFPTTGTEDGKCLHFQFTCSHLSWNGRLWKIWIFRVRVFVTVCRGDNLWTVRMLSWKQTWLCRLWKTLNNNNIPQIPLGFPCKPEPKTVVMFWLSLPKIQTIHLISYELFQFSFSPQLRKYLIEDLTWKCHAFRQK